MRDTERERQRHRQREKQAPRREPDVGLDPGTPGSRAEPKADTQLLSRPSVPIVLVSLQFFKNLNHISFYLILLSFHVLFLRVLAF